MAFTIKQIKALLSEAGVPTDNLTATAEDICSRHNTDLDAIKEERDNALKASKTLEETKKELEELKKANGKDAYKVKYETLKKEYDDFKADIESKKSREERETAYKALLKELHIKDTIIDKVVQLADLDGEEFEDGKFTNAKAMKKTLGEEWKDFIVESGTKGASVSTPPTNNGGKKTREEIYAKDDKGRYKLTAAERQAALAENLSNDE